MKWIRKYMALSFASFILFTPLSYSQHSIVKDGKVSAAIVVPEKAPEPVKFAADELAFFLEKMTGQKIPVVNTVAEDKNTLSIMLGESEEAEKAGVKVSELASDGYIIKSVGNKIFIAGKDSSGENADIRKKLDEVSKASFNQQKILMSPGNWTFERGTLYGVYRFLEELGVRWFFPGDQGTVIPSVKELVIKPLNIKEEPHFISRQIGEGNTRPVNLKDKSILFDQEQIGELGYTPANNILWSLRQKTSSSTIPLNHMPPNTGWVERFGKTHPEYFAVLENGKRDIDLNNPRYRSHQCYSEPGVIKTIVEDIEAYRRGDNAVTRGIPQELADKSPFSNGWSSYVFNGNISSVLPQDSFRACYCEKCKTLLPPEDTDRMIQHSKQVWTYVDKSGRELMKKLPDHKITCLAYQTYGLPYENMPKLPENVIVGFCGGIYKNPYNLVDEGNYQKLLGIIQSWKSVSSSPLAYWLHNLYRHNAPQKYGVPMYLPHLLAKLWKDLAKNGKWIYVEEEKDSVMFEHLSSYIMAKLSYSPELDVDALLNDYYEKFYGPKAAPIMKNIFDDIEKQCMKIGRASSGSIDIWEKYFNSEVLKNYAMQADEALKLASGTEYEKNVKLFSKHYLGLMQKGYDQYDRNVKKVLDKKGASASICAIRGPVKIDGILDEETWNYPTRTVTMRNNIDGKKTEWSTEVKLLRSPDKLYFGFTCHDPETLKRSDKEGKADSIEIFLDPDHSHDAYYQILIDTAGRITDMFFEGGGEPGQAAWNSRAEVAIKKYDDRWVVEIALPRSSFNNGLTPPVDRPWGANFCRTMLNAPNQNDRYSCWSPLLFGFFRQPDMFGHIYFHN